jgi:Rod binding domain-containing protein
MPKKAEDAARQFEGLMIAQMLREAREASKLDSSDDQASSETSTVMDMADQQFAQMLAQKGGIGLSHLAELGLQQKP